MADGFYDLLEISGVLLHGETIQPAAEDIDRDDDELNLVRVVLGSPL